MARYRMENLPQYRKLRRPNGDKFVPIDQPAYVVVGWTPNGKPVASIPLLTREAAERRLTLWRSKRYKISAVLEFDYA